MRVTLVTFGVRDVQVQIGQAHKVQSGCTGKRPRTEHVAPLNAFTDNAGALNEPLGTSLELEIFTCQVLLRDFRLLEEVDAAVDRADRDVRIREEDCNQSGC